MFLLGKLFSKDEINGQNNYINLAISPFTNMIRFRENANQIPFYKTTRNPQIADLIEICVYKKQVLCRN